MYFEDISFIYKNSKTDMKNTLEETNNICLKLNFSFEHDDKCKIKFLYITILQQH